MQNIKTNIFGSSKAELIQTILLPFLIHVAPKKGYPWKVLQDNINKNKDSFVLSPFYTKNIKYINGQIFFEYDGENEPLTNTYKPKLIIEWESRSGAPATLFDSLMDIDKRVACIANLFSCNESCMAEKTVDITVSSSHESSDNKEENQLTIITQSELQEKNELPTNEVTTTVDQATKGGNGLLNNEGTENIGVVSDDKKSDYESSNNKEERDVIRKNFSIGLIKKMYLALQGCLRSLFTGMYTVCKSIFSVCI